MLTVLLFVLPLGLDTFAIAASLGVAGLPARDRLRVSLVFAAFEAGMPVAGLIAGAAAGRVLGGIGEYAAIAGLIGFGLYLAFLRDGDEEAAGLLARSRGWAVVGLGLSVSLDELAIGFALGLLAVPIVAAIILIGLQAFLVSQLGLRAGSRVGERVREGAERLAGFALAAIGLGLLAAHLAGLTV